MTLYYIAFIVLVIRVTNFFYEWAFINGSYVLLGNLLAEMFILYAFYILIKKAKNGEIYKKNLEEYGKIVTNLGIDKSDTI